MNPQEARGPASQTHDWPALIVKAQAHVYPTAAVTPLARAPQLSAAIGRTVTLKREDQQPVFSFKLRGALNKLTALSETELARGVICSSAGNHAQGVALAARQRGARAVVVMPVTTPAIKISAVAALGGEVVLHGDTYDDAQTEAHARAEREGLTFIHPFDDPEVIAGQATIGTELLEQCPTPPTAIFIPIGGGGLAAGIALAVRAAWPDTRLIGVEPEQSASMQAAWQAEGPVTLERVGIFADGVAVKRVGELTYALARNLLDEIITVSTDQTCAAIRDIYEDTRTVVEPAGALAVAAIRRYARRTNTSDESGALLGIVCGANLNFDRLRHIAERAAFGDEREALFAVEISEKPGSFRAFCEVLGPVAVTEFNYRYQAGAAARIFVGVELREGRAERDRLLTRIRAAGYRAEDLSDNELARLHLRHLVGGRAAELSRERLFRFEFPERPGALANFLDAIGTDWNISLFHYRNHGSDYGRVLAGIEPGTGDGQELEQHLAQLGFAYVEETTNPAAGHFLR